MSCGVKEAVVFGMGIITGTGTTLYVRAVFPPPARFYVITDMVDLLLATSKDWQSKLLYHAGWEDEWNL
jgi:hypothetical protein